MKIAIIGAGLSGLSLAWHLMDKGPCAVTLFDAQGIAGGASGIPAGLLHSYPGKEGKYSHLAKEGIEATRRLLAVAQKKSALPLSEQTGILRYPVTEEARARFLKYAAKSDDVVLQDEHTFLIRLGMTIFCKRYLEALWLALEEKGAKLIGEKIESLQQLNAFDQIVLAAGAGVFAFPETRPLHIEVLKGQALTCRLPQGYSLPVQSQIARGYIAHVGEAGYCLLGSTYERGEKNPGPDWEKAKAELFPKASLLYPQAHELEVVDGFAAFRVMRIGHYCPIALRLEKNLWVCTALGSRGLLYHGLLGELLAKAIFNIK